MWGTATVHFNNANGEGWLQIPLGKFGVSVKCPGVEVGQGYNASPGIGQGYNASPGIGQGYNASQSISYPRCCEAPPIQLHALQNVFEQHVLLEVKPAMLQEVTVEQHGRRDCCSDIVGVRIPLGRSGLPARGNWGGLHLPRP